MVQFGHELRLEREQRRVSLEAMCASTKLSISQLHNVEAGNFGELPGGIFRKGFVRSYLRALQLDEPFWLERFEASYRASGLAENQEPDWAGFAENVRNNRLAGKSSGIGRKWLGVLGMAVLVALLAACVWKFVLLPRLHPDQHAGIPHTVSVSPLLVAVAPLQM
jgi:cytoskeleton protein RodZ